VAFRSNPHGDDVLALDQDFVARSLKPGQDIQIPVSRSAVPEHALDYSPDGKYVAVVSPAGHPVVWDAEKGELAFEPSPGEQPLTANSVWFLADGVHVFAAGGEGTQTWELRTDGKLHLIGTSTFADGTDAGRVTGFASASDRALLVVKWQAGWQVVVGEGPAPSKSIPNAGDAFDFPTVIVPVSPDSLHGALDLGENDRELTAALSPDGKIAAISSPHSVSLVSVRRIVASCKTMQPIYFGSDSANVSLKARSALKEDAACISANPHSGAVLLVGHTSPRGEDEYNIVIGARRADNVKSALTAEGIPAARIHTTSRGKLDATGSDEAGWALDHRVDVLWEDTLSEPEPPPAPMKLGPILYLVGIAIDKYRDPALNSRDSADRTVQALSALATVRNDAFAERKRIVITNDQATFDQISGELMTVDLALTERDAVVLLVSGRFEGLDLLAVDGRKISGLYDHFASTKNRLAFISGLTQSPQGSGWVGWTMKFWTSEDDLVGALTSSRFDADRNGVIDSRELASGLLSSGGGGVYQNGEPFPLAQLASAPRSALPDNQPSDSSSRQGP
jgi:peptidoglycan-associated lipoprotein